MHHLKKKLAKSTQSKVLSLKNDRTLNWLDLVTWLPGWVGLGIFMGGLGEGIVKRGLRVSQGEGGRDI